MKPRILSTARLSISLASAIAAMLVTQNIHATTFYYEGVTSQTWNSTASWTTNPAAANIGGARPVAADDVVFHMDGVNTNISMNLAGAQAANSIIYRSTGTLNIGPNSSSGSGNKTLTIGSGGLTKNAGSGALSFNGPANNTGTVGVAVGANQTWTNNSIVGALNIGTTFSTGTSTAGTMGLGSNTLTLDGPGDFNFGADGATSSVIGVSVGSTLIKSGTGTLTIGGSNAFSGATLISGGTLGFTSNGDINASSGITINGSTAKLLQTSSTAMVPTVTLTQGTLTGSGTVNTVSVANDAANIISNNNGVAGAALTVGDLTFAGAASIHTYNDTTAAAIVTTNLNTDAAGTVTVNPSVPPLVAGTYDLISYTAMGGAGAGQVVLGTVTGVTQRQNPVFGNSGTAFTLTVGADNPPYWSGEGDGNWNTTSTNNWKFISDNNPTTYIETDIVLFNDLATPASPVTVDINAANVSPSSTTFEGTKDYILNSSGTFGIATGGLTKNGTGSLTLNTANTYTGATTINGGTLSLGSGGTNGSLSPSSAINVASGASFAVNQSDTVVQGTDFGAITGAGGFTTGGGITQLNLPNTFTGNISITAGTLQMISGGRLTGGAYEGGIAIASAATFDCSGTANQTLSGIISGEGGLVKGSSSTLTLSGANTYQGSTAVNAGRLDLAAIGALGATSSISMADGTALRPTIDGVVIDSNISLGGSGTTAQINAPFTASAGGTVETLTLNQPITGTGNLRLFSSTSANNTNATILLNAQSTYSGNTELNTDGTAIHLAGVNLFVKLGVANALPPATVVTLDGNVGRGSGRTVSLDLNGFNQELAGLAAVTTHVARNQRVTNTSATLATLTINSSSDSAFGGSGPSSTFSGNPVIPTAKIIGNLALTKTGPAKFTLLGSHEYTGDTTVSQGILSQETPNTFNDASAVNIATSGATLDLDFDETSGAVTDIVNQLFIGGVQQPAGVYKATDNATDAGTAIAQITGPGTLTVTSGPAGGGYTSWAATNAGGEAADLDFDKDGVSNGVEFFMNAPAGLTANPQLNGSNTITWTNGGNIPASAYGTEFVIQTSSNLSIWADVPVGSLTTNTNGPHGALTFTLTGASPRFVRLKVTPN